MKKAWCYLFHWRHQHRNSGFGWYGWKYGRCGRQWVIYEDWVKEIIMQKAEWRARTIAAILDGDHDLDTKAEMLEAALNQAHSEGLLDAAYICDRVSKEATNSDARRVASVMADSFRDLDRRNRNKNITLVHS